MFAEKQKQLVYQRNCNNRQQYFIQLLVTSSVSVSEAYLNLGRPLAKKATTLGTQ